MPYRRKTTKKPIGKMAGYMGKKEPQKKKVPGVKTGVSKAPKYKGAPLAPKLKKKKKPALKGKLGIGKSPAQIAYERKLRQKALTKPKIKKRK